MSLKDSSSVLELASYLQFITDPIVDQEEAAHKDHHKVNMQWTEDKLEVIADFTTEVTSTSGGTKLGWSKEPISKLNIYEE